MQPESRPVLIGILFYLNELSLFKEDLKELKNEVEEKSTDIMPPESDLVNILQWNTRSKPPLISETFKILDFDAVKNQGFLTPRTWNVRGHRKSLIFECV